MIILNLQEIAKHVACSVLGDPATRISGVADLESAAHGDLVFAETERHLLQAEQTPASAIVIHTAMSSTIKPVIRSANPRYTFAQAMHLFLPPRKPAGVHWSAVIGHKVTLGEDITIGPYAVIEDQASIADGVFIGPGSYIGRSCGIGRRTQIEANVTLYENTVLGEACIVHAGAVIGGDGFGFVKNDEGVPFKIPQMGRVEIGAHCEIGCNVSIDRGTMGFTRIGSHTKIDNNVQIGHNVSIGRNCTISGLTGIAGSTTIGDNVTLAGQVGLADHVVLEDHITLAGQSGVPTGKRLKGKHVYFGSPARELHAHKRMLAGIGRLPNMLEQVRKLRQDIRMLTQRLQELEEQDA